MQRRIKDTLCLAIVLFVPLVSPSLAHGQQVCESASLQGALNASACVENGCYYDEKEATAEGTGLTCTVEPRACLDLVDQQNDPSIKGTVYGLTYHAYSQRGRIASYDYCDGNTLRQVSCGANNFVQYDDTSCTNSCVDGVCLPDPPSKQLAVRGRLIDQQSGSPLAGVTIYTDSINGRSVNPITTDSSGNFSYTYDAMPVLMHIVPKCNDQFVIMFTQLATGEYEADVPSYEHNDACGVSFPNITKQSQNGMLDVGEIRIRPARTVELYTSEAASFEVWFRKNASCSTSTFGGGGNSNVRNRHTLSITMIPGFESQIRLTKANGQTIESQWSLTPATTSCEAITVGYTNGQFQFGVCGDGVCTAGEEQTCSSDCGQQNICSDTDGGRNYSEKGTAGEGSKQYTDYCQDASFLFEYDCGSAGGTPTQDGCGHGGLGGCRYKCPYGCKDGACKLEQHSCKDSDGGYDIYKKGTVSGGGYSSTDTCNNASELVEYFCENGVSSYSRNTEQCPYGCKNGACLQEEDDDETGFRNATWACYDGVRSEQGGSTSCKTSETWQKYAEDSCRNHCYSDGSKCGVNSFSVSTECSLSGEPEGSPIIKRIWTTVKSAGEWGSSTTTDRDGRVTSRGRTVGFWVWIDARMPDGSTPSQGDDLEVLFYSSDNPADMTGGGRLGQYRNPDDGQTYFAIQTGMDESMLPRTEYFRFIAKLDDDSVTREAIVTFDKEPSTCDKCAIPGDPSVPPTRPPQGNWLYDTGRGGERVHKMTYAEYESEGYFVPSKDITIAAIQPDMWYCNGFCKMNIEIADVASNLLLASSSQQGSSLESFTGQLNNSVLLQEGGKYRITLQTSTTMSVGIYTASRYTPNANGYGTFTIESAASDFSDHLDRGTISFRLLEKTSSDGLDPPSIQPIPVRPPLYPPTIPPPAGFEDEVHTNEGRNWFNDVASDSAIGIAANALAEEGIIGGYADGGFKADKMVNRAEAAKFIMLAIGTKVEDSSTNGGFWDVLPGEWYAKYVVAAAESGIIKGNPDGSFRPAEGVNTVEFLAMLVRAFGDLGGKKEHTFSDVPADAWFAPYAGIAYSLQLFPDRGALLMPERQLTRGEVAQALYLVLQSSAGDISFDR